MNYAYNEDKMMEGIRAFRQEQRASKPAVIREVPKPKVEPEQPISTRIVMRTAEQFGIPHQLIRSASREAHLMMAREAIALILRQVYGYSLKRVGSTLGGRHHTTVMYAERIARERYESCPPFKALVDAIADKAIVVKRDEIGLPIQ